MPGCLRTSASATAASDRSPAKPMASLLVALRSAASAASTPACVRPLTMTRAPSAASVFGDGVTDARGAARDQRQFSGELQVHAFPRNCESQDTPARACAEAALCVARRAQDHTAMKVPPFKLDLWLAAHEFATPPIRYNLASSTGPLWTFAELMSLGGGSTASLDDVRLSYAPPQGGKLLRERIAALHGVDPGAGAGDDRRLRSADRAHLPVRRRRRFHRLAEARVSSGAGAGARLWPDRARVRIAT